MDTTTWPRVEARVKHTRLAGRQQYWGDWYLVAMVKEISAAKALMQWYRAIDPVSLEVRCVVWQSPKVLEE